MEERLDIVKKTIELMVFTQSYDWGAFLLQGGSEKLAALQQELKELESPAPRVNLRYHGYQLGRDIVHVQASGEASW